MSSTSLPTEYQDNFFFDNEQIQSLADPSVVRAGLRYYKDNRVTSLDWEAERLWAEVEDAETEEVLAVELVYDPNGNLQVACGCATDPDRPCTHALAALFAHGARSGSPGEIAGAADRRLVRDQLPDRIEQRLDLELTPLQRGLHDDAVANAGRLAHIAKKRPLTPSEQKRLLSSLQQARMACNAAGLVDKETEGSPKLDELESILEELCVQSGLKAVVFSQWEQMTRMVEQRLRRMGLGCVRLHGGVHSAKRGELIDRFHQDDAVQVFISTDAGGVGLNLQCASVLINLDTLEPGRARPANRPGAPARPDRDGADPVAGGGKLVRRACPRAGKGQAQPVRQRGRSGWHGGCGRCLEEAGGGARGGPGERRRKRQGARPPGGG